LSLDISSNILYGCPWPATQVRGISPLAFQHARLELLMCTAACLLRPPSACCRPAPPTPAIPYHPTPCHTIPHHTIQNKTKQNHNPRRQRRRPQVDVEAAAREANAHEFIAALPDGYATKVTDK
jgi:hypothetical protein